MTNTPDEISQHSRLTLPQALSRHMELRPATIALREKKKGVWREFSWREFHEAVRFCAIAFYSLGFRRGDRLAVASENTPEWLFADLAAQALGGACFGVYPTNPWPEVQYLLNHSRARFVVCGDQEQTDKVLDAQREAEGLPDLVKIICVDPKGMRGYDRPDLTTFEEIMSLGRRFEPEFGAAVDEIWQAGDPEDVAIIVYTSGTTGMPKGAMLSHRNMFFPAERAVRLLGLTAGNCNIVSYLPLCHVAERSISLAVQLICGSIINFAESTDTIGDNLREIAPTLFFGVPRIWEKMRQNVMFRSRDARPIQRRILEWCLATGNPIAQRTLANGGRPASLKDRIVQLALWLICFRSLQRYLGLSRIRASFCGGATVSADVLLFFWNIGVPVYQLYGMTETSGITNMQRPGFTAYGHAGPLVKDLELRLDADGEILIRGASVFSGYLFDPEATSRAIQNGWLRTGDVGEIGSNGELRVIDRKKDILITSGGKNITPSLIENGLKESLYISEAIILGEGKHFVSALLQIDFDSVGDWAQKKAINYTTYRSLAENPAVRELIAREVDRINERFARVEQVRKFVLLVKELDHDDGEVTATMKVRRRVIEQKFKNEISEIYGAA